MDKELGLRFKTEVIAPFIEDKYLLPTAISMFKIEEFKNVAKVGGMVLGIN